MVRSRILVALCAASGFEACLAEPAEQRYVDADGLSLLQTKAVVSRRAQEESYSKTDIENEWGLGEMFSSVVEAVHGAFQSDPNPTDDTHSLQLMEADKTVVIANTTARGVLHLVHGCNQCGFHFCDKASIKESKTGIEDSYLVGSALSEWGCDKVVNPYVVHDKRTRKVYAVEFLETQPKEESVVQKHSHMGAVDSKVKAKASKTEVKNSVNLEVKEKSFSEAKDQSVHKEMKSKTSGKKLEDTNAEKSSVAARADSTSKAEWPALPHLEAAEKIKEKISSMATAHAHSEDSEKLSKAIGKEKEDATAKQSSHKSVLTKTEEEKIAGKVSEDTRSEKDESVAQAKDNKLATTKDRTLKLSSDDLHSEDSEKEQKDKISNAKSVKSGEQAPKAKQHPHDSLLVKQGAALTEKEDLPDLKIPHVLQKAVERVEEKISSKVSEDKKSEIKGESTTQVKDSKSSVKGKESKKEKKDDFASTEGVKSDKHGAKRSHRPHDSLLMEHDVAMTKKEDLPDLKIPPVLQKAVERVQEKMSSNVSGDKKSEIKSESTTQVKDSKLAANSKESKKEKNDEHASAKGVKSDKHEEKTSQHPHALQKVVETAEHKISSTVSGDKKSEIKSESTTQVKDSKLAADTKNKKEDKHFSAKSVKSDRYESQTRLHQHDSMLMENGVAKIEKESWPNLKIPQVIQNVAETAERNIAGKAAESTSHAKDSNLAASKSKTSDSKHKEEKKDEHSNRAKASASTSTSKGHAAK